MKKVAGHASRVARLRVAICVLVALASWLPPQPAAASERLRIATYNIFVHNPDLDRSIETILGTDLDLVALQEVTAEQAGVLDRKLAERFPYRFFPKPAHGGGLALLSRRPLDGERYLPSDAGLNGFAFAQLDFDGRTVQVANLHLDPIRTWTLMYALTVPWQLLRQGAVHREELGQVWTQLQPEMATVVLGDLNTFASAAAATELSQWGLTDSYASVHADAAATHRSEVLGLSIGTRMDFIFQSWQLRTVESWLVPGQPSDHDMLVSTFEWVAS